MINFVSLNFANKKKRKIFHSSYPLKTWKKNVLGFLDKQKNRKIDGTQKNQKNRLVVLKKGLKN